MMMGHNLKKINPTMKKDKALLVLESGRAFWGESFGAPVETLGEVVFNTSMTGYQEILTDPSYKGQTIVMTEPHIGNVGINKEDMESRKVFAEGLIVREASPLASNWRSKESLQEFLIARKVPAMDQVDTRALTKHLREAGVMRGVLSTTDFDVDSLLKKIRGAREMEGSDLVKEVTCSKSYDWEDPEWSLDPIAPAKKKAAHKIVMMDFGLKQNILRCLASRGAAVTVVSAKTSAKEILSLNPDGIMLSNGPGDPAAVTYAIQTIRELMQIPLEQGKKSVPIFGICLGHQLLGLAMGGKTFKLKFGHRGCNHPVKDLVTGKIEITTQNHGFCVDINSLPASDAEITHVNLNDNTLEGLRHKKLPVFSVQYHPESSGGPHDSRYLFDRFTALIQDYQKRKG